MTPSCPGHEAEGQRDCVDIVHCEVVCVCVSPPQTPCYPWLPAWSAGPLWRIKQGVELETVKG